MPHDHPRTEIDTPRLTLLAFTPADGLRGFYVSGEVSPVWLEALRNAAAQRGGPNPWRHGFFIIEKESGEIVGGAGFKGARDAAGRVEIAYGVVPPREGRGYATEAARALIH